MKVSALNDLEYRVWLQSMLSADDFGVIPAAPAILRGANLALASRPEPVVEAAWEQVFKTGLVLDFHHQDQRFFCDPVWQDFQKVTYPRRTFYPYPPRDTFTLLSLETQELFRKHSGNVPKEFFSRCRRLRGLPHANANVGVNAEGKEGESEGKPLFVVADSIQDALRRSPAFAGVPRLFTSTFWQAEIRANPGVYYPKEILKAQAWLVANPNRPKKDLVKFLHNWLANAERETE